MFTSVLTSTNAKNRIVDMGVVGVLESSQLIWVKTKNKLVKQYEYNGNELVVTKEDEKFVKRLDEEKPNWLNNFHSYDTYSEYFSAVTQDGKLINGTFNADKRQILHSVKLNSERYPLREQFKPTVFKEANRGTTLLYFDKNG
jgi:hypothetical protein